MSSGLPNVLLPVSIDPSSAIFLSEICLWRFADPFVARLLRNDIPQRVKFGRAKIWAYRDSGNEIVGFGTIDVCRDYPQYTNNKPHPLIPLLAVNPGNEGRGYGGAIIRHLIGEAALLAADPGAGCDDILFLEAYATSIRAIALYEKNGFVKLTDNPIFDPIEQQFYFVMARRISVLRGI